MSAVLLRVIQRSGANVHLFWLCGRSLSARSVATDAFSATDSESDRPLNVEPTSMHRGPTQHLRSCSFSETSFRPSFRSQSFTYLSTQRARFQSRRVTSALSQATVDENMASLLAKAACPTRAATPAIVAVDGTVVTYGQLMQETARYCSQLRELAKSLDASFHRTGNVMHDSAGALGDELKGARVGLMVGPGPEYAAATFAIWLCGGVSVPLALGNPAAELKYSLEDSGAALMMASSPYLATLDSVVRELDVSLVNVTEFSAESSEVSSCIGEAVAAASKLDEERGALIIYTSGTTGRPKGALHSHRSLKAQIYALVNAWEWASRDRMLHCLPLHHIHGIVNGLFCALDAGACLEFLPKFSPTTIWRRMVAGHNGSATPITVYMGVPTMYVRLLQAYAAMPDEEKAAAKAAAGALRLTVSGSAACPVPVMNEWEETTGQRLLERYGMTEIGMALSNPYSDERRPGTVGQPLPGVEVKMVQAREVRGAPGCPVRWPS